MLAVSDGVHDNLDPEHLGFDPPELVDDLVVQNAPQGNSIIFLTLYIIHIMSS